MNVEYHHQPNLPVVAGPNLRQQLHIIPEYNDDGSTNEQDIVGHRRDHENPDENQGCSGENNDSGEGRRRCVEHCRSSFLNDDALLNAHCIDLFERCYVATCQVGSTVVKREIHRVHQELASFFGDRHRLQPNNAVVNKKKRSFEEKGLDDDDVSASRNVTPSEDDNSDTMITKKRRISYLPKEMTEASATASTGEEEHHRGLLWQRAHRMKRLSSLFRQMEMIQRTILYEMKNGSY